MPYLTLPSSHYASGWSQDREIRNIKDVTEVGVRYVNESDPKKKEELLLELVRRFLEPVYFGVPGLSWDPATQEWTR